MTIAITAATGQLGALVVDGLLESVPADQLVLAARQPDKAARFAERGVRVLAADYSDPAGWDAVLSGVDRLLLISGSEVGRRVAQHSTVVRAAAAAGVGHIVYTSVLHAATTTLSIAPEHKATEEVIRESGLPFTFLRNGWYTENYADRLANAVATGTLVGAAGEGRVASATRADYAAAAVAVLTGDGHLDKAYELSGDHAWSFPELAAAAAAASGKEVTYQDVAEEKYAEILVAAGLPEGVAAFSAHLETEIRDGVLADTPGDLSDLIGRPTTPLADAVAALLSSS